MLLFEGPFAFASGDAGGAIFLLAFAAGWFSIAILSRLLTREPQWWAVIPGSVLALVGLALLLGGVAMTVLEVIGNLWPLALIVIGAYLLLKRR